MRKLLVFCVFVSGILSAAAQPFGNEWINYNQQYYYFPVYAPGIYRIDSATLASAIGQGTLAGIDPRNIQLFSRSKEEFIFVNGESDGVFNSGDYIEFYAEGNDGRLDSNLYRNPSHHPNPYFSQFNDTIYYYLSWSVSATGKRFTEETDINFPASAPAFFWKELRFAKPGDDVPGYNPYFYYGERLSGSLTDPAYGIASGFMDAPVYYGAFRALQFPTAGAYLSGPDARAEVLFFGQTDAAQNPDHHIEITYGSSPQVTAYDTIFDGFKAHRVNFNIPAPVLAATTQVAVISRNDFNTATNPNPAPANEYISIGFVRLKYPHLQDLENKSEFRMTLPDDPSGKFHLSATGFSGSNPVLYDLSNGLKIPVVIIGGVVKALIPNSGSEKTVYIADNSSVKMVSYLKPAGNSGSFTDFNLYTGDYLIVSHTSLMPEATAYAAYRSNGYDPVLADVEELYHQFGYGVRKHPSAIRNFADFAVNTWTDSVNFLFLLGKSIHASETRKYALQGNNSVFNQNLVPSLGAKSSDILLTAGLGSSSWAPAIATGRLAAVNGGQVNDYLNKVDQYESWPAAEKWMKNVVHFHGGSSVSEQTLLSFYLNSYKALITDTLVGARVFDFYKSSTAPIQGLSMTDSIRKIINKGTNLLTFFGHAAGSSFDINIDKASTYNNFGKYPLVIANSCLVGDIHLINTSTPTTSEDFVLTPEKGAIGFIASVGLGTPTDLNDFSTEMYRQFSTFNYGGAIGISMKNTLEKLNIYYPQDLFLRLNVQQLNLHGDPAVSLYGFELPDLDVTAGPAWFEPSSVSTDMDSLSLKLVVSNNARAFNQTYAVRVVRTFFDGTRDTLLQTVAGGHYSDTLNFRFPTDPLRGGGMNLFHVTADESDNITELSELNNDDTIQLYIRSDDIIPAWPYEFAVVPSAQFILKASTGDPFAPVATYRFEVDTSAKFNSVVKKSGTVTASGGVVKFSPPGLNSLPDSTVFFWRVAKDTVSGFKWRESSFQVIAGKEGWGQAHFDQYKKDGFNFLIYDTLARKFSLDTTAKHLIATNIGNPQSVSQSYGIEFKLDAQIQDYAGCGWYPNSALHVVVIDSASLQTWGTKWTSTNPAVTFNPNNNFGNVNNESSCRARVENFFIFRTASATQMDSMASMLNNKIAAGHYVMVYSYLNNMRSLWTPALVNAFAGLGASSALTNIQDSIPFIFFAKKGYPSTVVEKIGNHKFDVLSLDEALYSNLDYGWMHSTLIGPAKQWNALYMQHTHLEQPTSDSSSVTVIGVTASGVETTLNTYGSDNVEELNLSIDANQYPFLKLKAFKGDDVLRTPPQMYRWQVLYEPVPELALNPSSHFSFQSPLVQEGETVKASVAVSNISPYDMDSTYLSWYTEDALRNRRTVSMEKIGPVPADSTRIASVSFNSLSYQGPHQLYMEVNPKDASWQREQHHFNNLGTLAFTAEADRKNPLLDITFDGVHILNRDIVSPTAMVVIGLKDENKFLLLNDTSNFGVYLVAPGASDPKRLNFSTDMQFVPAVSSANSCRIIFKGNFEKDGIYKLLVQASDRSQNKSGGGEGDLYEIEFEVIHKSSVTEVLNYPNPFSTSTRFVFVLTGSKVPDRFRIQIFTVTGKLVKEIDQYELGTIRIGRNISEYAWDGRDMYGDQLANGVYLYRVHMEIDGRDIEHRSTEADGYFHKGYGKMYLLRGN